MEFALGIGRDRALSKTINAVVEATVCNHPARWFAIAPSRSPEQSREALTLAQRAAALDFENGGNWNTLALARNRADAWPGASSAVNRAMRLHDGVNPKDWVILAMIRWRLGDRAEARRWYDLVTIAIKSQNYADEDLRRLRDEAAALLGISPTGP
jgi:hypothetical protein